MLARIVLVPALLLCLDRVTAKDVLAFAPAAGTKLERKLESHYTLGLESFAMSLDGEDVSPESLGKFDLHVEHSEHSTITDTFEELGAGRPQRLRRSFDELGGKETTRSTSDEGAENDDSDYASALEGKVVLFTWNEKAGRCDAAYAPGSEGDPELLSGLEEDLDLRRLLPSEPPSAGDSWEIDGQVFQSILGPGGDLALVAKGDESPRDTSTMDAQMRENMSGTIHATYRGMEEEGGARFARIDLTLETKTHAEDEMEPDEDGTSGTNRTEVGFRLEGELRWDTEHGHARSLELGGEYTVALIYAMHGVIDGEAFDQKQQMNLAGEIHLTARIERP